MGKNSFLWSLRFVDKGKRACIVKYVKSVMIRKVKYFTLYLLGNRREAQDGK